MVTVDAHSVVMDSVLAVLLTAAELSIRSPSCGLVGAEVSVTVSVAEVETVEGDINSVGPVVEESCPIVGFNRSSAISDKYG